MSVVLGLALVLLGLAIGFVVAWAFGVGASMGLLIGLLLLVAGAIVGFVVEWLIDEAYRKNRELRRLLREEGQSVVVRETSGSSPEIPAEVLQRRDEEIGQFREQLAEAQSRLEALRDEFSEYRQTHPDDLTVIKGIGSVYQWKLHDAGVNTYDELAESEPEKLRRMLDIKEWQATDVESWIEQARDWAQRSQ